jgi:transposase
MTYSRFLELFPDNDACLEHGTPCPKCERPSKFHRIKGRSAYSCQYCGHHVYPTAGTIFHKTTVSLQLWFFAIYLMSSTRCGISAKQLEREIGVTYKTAHRMFKQIRSLLWDQGEELLSGEVEVDETAGGAKHVRAGDSRRGLGYQKRSYRPTIWGAVERGGQVRVKVVKSRSTLDVEKRIYTHVLPSTMIFTDEFPAYNTERLARHFRGHKRIRHEDKLYGTGTSTHRQSRGSSGCSRTASGASTTRYQASGCSPIWTSMRGATTIATTRGLCSGRCSIRSRSTV